MIDRARSSGDSSLTASTASLGSSLSSSTALGPRHRRALDAVAREASSLPLPRRGGTPAGRFVRDSVLALIVDDDVSAVTGPDCLATGLSYGAAVEYVESALVRIEAAAVLQAFWRESAGRRRSGRARRKRTRKGRRRYRYHEMRGMYVGSLSGDGERDGHGTLTWDNGAVLTGTFSGGRPTRGVMVYPNGDVYEGTFGGATGYCKHGRGTYTWSSPGGGAAGADVYDGRWEEDRRSGVGTRRYANGDWFRGEWRDGKRSGWGLLRYADGGSFLGEFDENRRSGKGTRRYPNGQVVERDFGGDGESSASSSSCDGDEDGAPPDRPAEAAGTATGPATSGGASAGSAGRRAETANPGAARARDTPAAAAAVRRKTKTDKSVASEDTSVSSVGWKVETVYNKMKSCRF